ncbi:MAG: four helix bundle protein [Bacteroidetes bacterium 46-16]|nr:MAG: four helix bundle protein [Bacteroidetes bacterium 46-16]
MENLIVFKKAYDLAMEVFVLTKTFPKEEIYSLTDQVRRSSRSICANIGEAYRKRKYPKNFISKLTDADGECTETLIHLNFAKDCGYLDESNYTGLRTRYLEVGKMLGAIINKPENFIIST